MKSWIPFTLPGLEITEVEEKEQKLIIHARGAKKQAKCPECQHSSSRRHSNYTRTIKDLPISLKLVEIHLAIQRFRCANTNCSQRTFAEQHLAVVPRRVRRTDRLSENITEIGIALGGQAGARLAGKLRMPVSGSTILRLLRQIVLPSFATPRVIGIDDWAFRKGRKYGTLIVDHERGKPIDLLPARDCETVMTWLENHPTIEVVTRDRSGEYREAVTQALPDAIQIADRWHLLKNLGQAVQRHITRRYKVLSQVVAYSISGQTDPNIKTKQRRYDRGPAGDMIHEARTEKREALFAAVKARRAEGAYITNIAKEFNLSRPTVIKWTNYDTLPPDARGRFKNKCLIDDYIPYLQKRIIAGCHNQTQLWREICKLGFTGKRPLVTRWIRQNYKTNGQALEILPREYPDVIIPSYRELSWLLIRHTEELEEDEKQVVAALIQDDKVAELRQLAHQFMKMIRQGTSCQWQSWLESSCESTVQELRNFALGLKKDSSAIYEAIRQPWSNGATEGHVNRLKFLKRQMYGRANFDLLRLRVLLVD
jgi:transposase